MGYLGWFGTQFGQLIPNTTKALTFVDHSYWTPYGFSTTTLRRCLQTASPRTRCNKVLPFFSSFWYPLWWKLLSCACSWDCVMLCIRQRRVWLNYWWATVLVVVIAHPSRPLVPEWLVTQISFETRVNTQGIPSGSLNSLPGLHWYPLITTIIPRLPPLFNLSHLDYICFCWPNCHETLELSESSCWRLCWRFVIH